MKTTFKQSKLKSSTVEERSNVLEQAIADSSLGIDNSILKLNSKTWPLPEWESYLASLEGALRETQLPSDLEQTALATNIFEVYSSSAPETLTREVEQMLQVLSQKQRFVIQAIYWEGASERKIAKSMGISRTAVQRIKARALKKLKSLDPDTVSIFPLVGTHTNVGHSEEDGGSHVD